MSISSNMRMAASAQDGPAGSSKIVCAKSTTPAYWGFDSSAGSLTPQTLGSGWGCNLLVAADFGGGNWLYFVGSTDNLNKPELTLKIYDLDSVLLATMVGSWNNGGWTSPTQTTNWFTVGAERYVTLT